MYQKIHENISVAGVYNEGNFRPKKFLWNQREYLVQEVTFLAEIKDGGKRLRQYSVVSANTVFRLMFDREDETWWVEEIWLE